MVEPLRAQKSVFKSKKLKSLLNFTNEYTFKGKKGLIPEDLSEAISEFEYLVVWKKASDGEEDIPEPRAGIDENFDIANKEVNVKKAKLDKYLDYVKNYIAEKNDGKKQSLVNQITFVNCKLRYEIEVPAELVSGKKKPGDFEITSEKHSTKVQRFHTQRLRDLMDELDKAEENLKDAITPFVCALFQRFYESRNIWQPVVQIISELDCLQSLTVTSFCQNGAMCRPEILPYTVRKDGGKRYLRHRGILEIRDLRHPCVEVKPC